MTVLESNNAMKLFFSEEVAQQELSGCFLPLLLRTCTRRGLTSVPSLLQFCWPAGCWAGQAARCSTAGRPLPRRDDDDDHPRPVPWNQNVLRLPACWTTERRGRQWRWRWRLRRPSRPTDPPWSCLFDLCLFTLNEMDGLAQECWQNRPACAR